MCLFLIKYNHLQLTLKNYKINQQLLEKPLLYPSHFLARYLLHQFNIYIFYTSRIFLKTLLKMSPAVSVRVHVYVNAFRLCVNGRNHRHCPTVHLTLSLCCARPSLPLVRSIDSFISFAFVPPLFLPSPLPNPFLLF